MGYFSELDVEIRTLVGTGASREVVANAYPELTEVQLDQYMADDHDGDSGDWSDDYVPAGLEDDGEALASAGFGTDEDYGYFGGEE